MVLAPVRASAPSDAVSTVRRLVTVAVGHRSSAGRLRRPRRRSALWLGARRDPRASCSALGARGRPAARGGSARRYGRRDRRPRPDGRPRASPAWTTVCSSRHRRRRRERRRSRIAEKLGEIGGNGRAQDARRETGNLVTALERRTFAAAGARCSSRRRRRALLGNARRTATSSPSRANGIQHGNLLATVDVVVKSPAASISSSTRRPRSTPTSTARRAPTDDERQLHQRAFTRDVRDHIDAISARSSIRKPSRTHLEFVVHVHLRRGGLTTSSPAGHRAAASSRSYPPRRRRCILVSLRDRRLRLAAGDRAESARAGSSARALRAAGVFAEHFAGRSSLEDCGRHYNKDVGSLETRVSSGAPVPEVRRDGRRAAPTTVPPAEARAGSSERPPRSSSDAAPTPPEPASKRPTGTLGAAAVVLIGDRFSSGGEMGSMNEIRDLIIIGGGPAGYTAALYSARGELRPLVIEGFQWGGQLMAHERRRELPGLPRRGHGPQDDGGLPPPGRAVRRRVRHRRRDRASTSRRGPFRVVGRRTTSTARRRSSSRPARARAGSGSSPRSGSRAAASRPARPATAPSSATSRSSSSAAATRPSRRRSS